MPLLPLAVIVLAPLAALMVSPAPLAVIVPPAVLVLSSVTVSPNHWPRLSVLRRPPAPRSRPPVASVPLTVVSPAWLIAAAVRYCLMASCVVSKYDSEVTMSWKASATVKPLLSQSFRVACEGGWPKA